MRARARALAAARTDQLQLVEAHRRLALQDSALHVLGGVRAGVLLEEVHALDDGSALRRIHAQDLPLLAAIPAADHDDVVALLDVGPAVRLGFEFGLFSVHDYLLRAVGCRLSAVGVVGPTAESREPRTIR